MSKPRVAKRSLAPKVRAGLRARAGGMTLVEVLIVMAIVVVVLGGVFLGTGQLASARLRRGTTLITGAVRTAYTRATVTSRSTRLVFDFERNVMWLEEADQPMVVRANDTSGAGGADPATQAEQAAVAEGERLVKGPEAPRPHFRPVSSSELATVDNPAKNGDKYERPLPRGIVFRGIQTAHDAEMRTSGRAYLYFWPGGQTELATVQIKIDGSTDDAQTVSLVTAPLTGKVAAKEGAVTIEVPTDDKTASEREDNGAW